EEGLLLLVARFHRPQHPRIEVDHFRGADQSLDVLGEAGAAVAGAGVDEVIADTRIRPNALAYHLDISAEQLGQVGHFVHEADLGRQDAVGGVLGPLGSRHSHDDDLFVNAVERRVELAHHLLGFAAVGPDDDAVRPHAVRHGGAFLEKLGVGHYVEGQLRVAALGQDGFDRRADLAGRAHRHGRPVDDDAVPVHVLGDGGGDRQHILQVGGAILVRGRANGDELDTAVAYTGRRVGGELQPASGVVVAHQVFQARFIDRNLALLQA